MKKNTLLILFALATIGLPAQTIYVKNGATGNGSAWSNACSLEQAVAKPFQALKSGCNAARITRQRC